MALITITDVFTALGAQALLRLMLLPDISSSSEMAIVAVEAMEE
jgi:hypothetical protein